MKKLKFLFFVALIYRSSACPWSDYAGFEISATNALEDVRVLMSSEYTNRLISCRRALAPTNAMASASLLILAISDCAKSIHDEEFVGILDCQTRLSWFVDSPVLADTLWQKSCAITMLSTENLNSDKALVYLNCATNALHSWDAMGNCFDGGTLYAAVARYFNATELNPRQCFEFAAADSARKAGLLHLFEHYVSLLPAESRDFLEATTNECAVGRGR